MKNNRAVKKSKIIQGDCRIMDLVKEYNRIREEWEERLNNHAQEHNQIVEQANVESKKALSNLWKEICKEENLDVKEALNSDRYFLDLDHFNSGNFILFLEMYPEDSEKEQLRDEFIKQNEDIDEEKTLNFKVNKKVIH